MLRTRGYTYSEIQKKLGFTVPKSTMSYWSKDVSVPKFYKGKVRKLNSKNLEKARNVAWIVNKVKRERYMKDIRARAKVLCSKIDDLDIRKLILAVLHLGEGAKWKSHHGLMLGSSDPDIILLYIKLLESCYNISRSEFRCRVSYRVDQDIDVLQEYWSKITRIPLANFYKTKPDPRTAGKKTKNKNYMGVCVIMRKGTEIQLELEAIPKIVLRGL